MPSPARQMLRMARFFSEQARRSADTNDRDALTMYLQAAIVFGRSVTFALQKECARASGFSEWYEQKQAELRNDPVAKFFLETRNVILKQGPIAVPKETNIAIHESVLLSDCVQVKVIRGVPWYRRSPKVLWEDFGAPALTRLSVCLRRLLSAVRPKRRANGSTSVIVDRYRFDTDDLKDRSAFEALDEYLAVMERIVSDAEKVFPASG
jgi:hypothetical protein